MQITRLEKPAHSKKPNPRNLNLPGAIGEVSRHELTSGDSRDYTKDPVNIMDILELHAFKERMDGLKAAQTIIWLGAR